MAAYSEGFKVVHADAVAEKVQQCVLEHASVTVTVEDWNISKNSNLLRIAELHE